MNISKYDCLCLVPPRWTVEPSDTNVVLGFDIILDCQAEGYPEPTIIWRKAVGKYIALFC